MREGYSNIIKSRNTLRKNLTTNPNSNLNSSGNLPNTEMSR